jgi:hypothetical protein
MIVPIRPIAKRVRSRGCSHIGPDKSTNPRQRSRAQVNRAGSTFFFRRIGMLERAVVRFSTRRLFGKLGPRECGVVGWVAEWSKAVVLKSTPAAPIAKQEQSIYAVFSCVKRTSWSSIAAPAKHPFLALNTP